MAPEPLCIPCRQGPLPLSFVVVVQSEKATYLGAAAGRFLKELRNYSNYSNYLTMPENLPRKSPGTCIDACFA
jgi:hypothetical protein